MKPPIEKPEYTPICCGEISTWVCISVNLYYFYCQKCKQEVPKREAKSDDDIIDWAFDSLYRN